MDDVTLLDGAGKGPAHGFPFDPTHGFSKEALLRVGAPDAPADFEAFWRDRYAAAMEIEPRPELRDTGTARNGWRIWKLSYRSTDRAEIRGWILTPERGGVRRGFVVGHGYGARTEADFHLPFEEAMLVFPCARGLGASVHETIPDQPEWHVLHGIEDRDRYVIGGCVEDIWHAVSVLLRVRPDLEGHIGYLGGSFGGGIGALALAWDDRIMRGHLNVPTFGNQPLRLQLASTGSAASVQKKWKRKPEVAATLAYYDAAAAARFIRQPMHCSCALFDPAVAPAGQFAVYNAIASEKRLFVLPAGHHEYAGQVERERELLREIHDFFRDL